VCLLCCHLQQLPGATKAFPQSDAELILRRKLKERGCVFALPLLSILLYVVKGRWSKAAWLLPFEFLLGGYSFRFNETLWWSVDCIVSLNNTEERSLELGRSQGSWVFLCRKACPRGTLIEWETSVLKLGAKRVVLKHSETPTCELHVHSPSPSSLTQEGRAGS
jgi:hypothetical protein